MAAWIRWWSGETPSVDSVTTPWIVAKFFDLVDFMLPDFLFGVFNPLLQYAKVYWMQALIAVAVLVVFGLLKLWFETASRHLALDAWRSFREKINPPKAAAKVG